MRVAISEAGATKYLVETVQYWPRMLDWYGYSLECDIPTALIIQQRWEYGKGISARVRSVRRPEGR